MCTKTIPLEKAVGTTLAHDMTQIIPGKSKGPAFKKGHKIKAGDLCQLMRMG
ncbi:MAG: molybdopterin-binding protein, partial [Desulfobacula sp.]|nr:molybdopterin-binding protein [Desulfobacula sp.]